MARGVKTGGRQKGTPNKTTALLKDAILEAAEAVGEDRKGAGGLMGYCKFLAADEPKAFAALLGKVLPMQVTGADGEPLLAETDPRQLARAIVAVLGSAAIEDDGE